TMLSIPASLFFLSVAFILFLKKSHQKRARLPPGPPGHPFIGHVLKIPAESQDLALYKLGKTYGDVMYLEMFGRPIVVLNSVEAAIDLLDKRSANYSDRPHFPIFELMGWRETLTFTGSGKLFKKYRRLCQEHLKSTKIIVYQPVQRQATRILLQNLLSDDSLRNDWIRRFSTSIIMRVAYGHQITSDDDPYLDITENTSIALGNAGAPGTTPVDFFPFLQNFPSWFPGAYYAGFARSQKGAIRKLHDYPFDNVKAELAAGTAKPAFASHELQSLSLDEADNSSNILDIKGVAGVMYCAGAETTWATLSVFFLAMVLHPECQKRAQQEIDSVVGPGRLPEFSDRESLPYVDCILQETLRWNPVVPSGIPHRSLEDDIYRGMFIPKGSLVIGNTRGMALDEKVYTDAQAFNPSRYLPLPEGNHEPYPHPFGFGRRICPGRHLADASVWIAMASILATFDILKPIGSDGKEITPEVKFSTGITSQPSTFYCHIRPRNDQARDLIMHADTSDNY
ncbi:O-methylsterigmatocystin oxidoreductase, partial [Termitomyces sp. J132]